MSDIPATMTLSNGAPVDDNQNSLAASADISAPLLLQDLHLINKLAHFDRERIPERVVHAKGAGAYGYFEVTHDVTAITKAAFLGRVGKRTPVFARFSTVGGEKGSADAARDPRGFAVKFYTEEGNYDMVGNNTPVFFIRDPIKFPDLIHTQKRNPRTNLKDPDMFWDFFSLTPESCHQVTILFSDRGTPISYRHMNGYSSHTLKMVAADGTASWVKWHFKTDQGARNFTAEEAAETCMNDPDHATRDLFDSIEDGAAPSWTVKLQVMPYDDAWDYRFNPFDVTKVWPHEDYPLIDVGRLVLDRNPENYFAETEQAAFSPGHFVPGIEASPDKMLQGRLFSYPDTHRHRLGANYEQIPVNCPYATRVHTTLRDGFMTINNQGREPNYEPNSFGGAEAKAEFAIAPIEISGTAGRHRTDHVNDDYVQAGNLYRDVMTEEERERLVANIVGHLKDAQKFIQERMVRIFSRCDRDFGARVAAGLAHFQSRL